MTQAPLLAIAQKSFALDRLLKAEKSGDASGILLLGQGGKPYALVLPASPRRMDTLSSMGCVVDHGPASALKPRIANENLFRESFAIVATSHQKPAYVIASLHLAAALGISLVNTPVINIERPLTIYHAFEDAAGGMFLKKDELRTQRLRSVLLSFQGPGV